MRINNTTTYETQQNTTTNSTQTTAMKFDIANYTNKTPKEISFDEYKYLTKNDETFNRAIHKMILEERTMTPEDISSFMGQIKTNILQMHYGEKFQASFVPYSFSNSVEHPYFLEKDDMDVDFEKLIDTAMLVYGNKATIPNLAQEQYQELTKWYSTLSEYYDEFKSNKLLGNIS